MSFYPGIEHQPPGRLRPYSQNARVHSKKQIKQIADSIKRFGFTNPVLVSDENEIIAGHGRVKAALELGLVTVPTLRFGHLSETERRAYILADNKLALIAGWDQDTLAIELEALVDFGFDAALTGFSLAEIDFTLDAAKARNPEGSEADANIIPALRASAICRPGELWRLGRHRLICGDAQEATTYEALMAGEMADLIFTDPPYNVPIAGNVSGGGQMRHDDFAMASGEMSKPAFTAFLTKSLAAMANVTRDGAIAFVCMDWRHMGELLVAGEAVFTELKNLCVWNKTNGGMGSFYRSKHELIFVYKLGDASHINSFELGQTGRNRTNVWDYPGMSSFAADRGVSLSMHPTVKPVALVADAIKDCSRRGALVLDGFGGSGTSLIAAETTGRSARLVELDPLYCDVILRRYQAFTGKKAVHAFSGTDFETIEAERESPTLEE